MYTQKIIMIFLESMTYIILILDGKLKVITQKMISLKMAHLGNDLVILLP